jgi:hypothetical protein
MGFSASSIDEGFILSHFLASHQRCRRPTGARDPLRLCASWELARLQEVDLESAGDYSRRWFRYAKASGTVKT